MNKNKLIIKNINHAYAHAQSIIDFSLTIEPGEIVCLLGPSGSGKTTLLKLIAGFENPSSGNISIGGEVIAGSSNVPTEKRGIGMLFQDIALFPHLSVGENVGFSLKNSPIENRSKSIKQYLESINLYHLINRYPHSISGGEQQRVALIRALASKPKAMLLDEPFSSLDVWTKFEVAEEVISFLKASSTPTLMVTHDPQEAMRLCDKILVIMNGRVIDEGSPEKLYSSPITPFSARISGPASIIRSKSIQGIIHTPFGKINKFSNIMDDKEYEIFIRPEAFSISYNLDKGINVKIKALKNLGGIYQLSLLIDGKDEVEKIFFPSGIIEDLKKGAKLLFNKDWAFVFPILK